MNAQEMQTILVNPKAKYKYDSITNEDILFTSIFVHVPTGILLHLSGKSISWGCYISRTGYAFIFLKIIFVNKSESTEKE